MATIQERLIEAKERADKRDNKEFPEAWKPSKDGETLEGKVTEIENGFGKSEDLLFWTVETKGGKEYSVLECATLSTARMKQKIIPGDKIGIMYRGEGVSKSGRTFKKFVVVKE